MSSTLAILGRSALIPGPATPFDADPELTAGLEGTALPTLVRTLSGRLDRRPEGMSRWSRLDRYGRALASACDAAVVRGRDLESMTGLVVSSQRSCHETNASFDRGLIDKEPRLASPFLFPYTLPGAAAAEVAMLLQLGGPYLVLPGGPAAALASLVAAVDLLDLDHAPRLVVASADVLGAHTMRDLSLSPTAGLPPPAEAAAALWLGRPDDPAPGPRRRLSAVLGAGATSAPVVEALMRAALADAGLEAEDVQEVITTSVSPDAWQVESAAATALTPDTPLLQLACRIGDAGAVLGLLAVQAALDDDGPRLVLGADRFSSVAMVVQ